MMLDWYINDILTLMYNLIEYSDAYSKKSRSLWQYYRGESALDNNNSIIDFPANENNSTLFKFKQNRKQETAAQKMLK